MIDAVLYANGTRRKLVNAFAYVKRAAVHVEYIEVKPLASGGCIIRWHLTDGRIVFDQWTSVEVFFDYIINRNRSFAGVAVYQIGSYQQYDIRDKYRKLKRITASSFQDAKYQFGQYGDKVSGNLWLTGPMLEHSRFPKYCYGRSYFLSSN